MKSLHRAKALEAYSAGRITLKQGMSYPSYMMLKEAARGTLSYLIEDINDKEISEKTKLSNLLEWSKGCVISDKEYDILNELVKFEQGGLESILTIPLDKLKMIKKVLKKIIAEQLGENL